MSFDENEGSVFFLGLGYSYLKEVNGEVCGIMPFLFTVGVCVGLDRTGYRGRFCFVDLSSAVDFLHRWDGHTMPVIGEDGCRAIKFMD